MLGEKRAADHNEASAEQWGLRVAVAEFLAFSLTYPSLDLAAMLVDGRWLEAAGEMAAESGIPWSRTEWESTLATGIDGTPTKRGEALTGSLRAEATRLFVGAPNPLVSPYESVWRAQEDGVKALLFVNPHSMDVERFAKECGLGRPEGTNEPLDHVVTELELLAYLASLASGDEAPDDAMPSDALPGGDPTSAYRRFFSEHPAKWLSSFAEALEETTRLPYYRAVALLLKLSLPSLSVS